MISKNTEELLTLVKEQYKAKGIGPLYTGEMELLITSDEFYNKLNSNPDGKSYFAILTEYGINLRANNLIQMETIDEKMHVLIPDWDLLITALDIYTRLTKFVQRRQV